MDADKLIFGENEKIIHWDMVGKKNFTDFNKISDMLILRLWNKLNYEDTKALRKILLQALFMLINYHNREFFPITASQKTYVVMVFENFLKQI